MTMARSKVKLQYILNDAARKKTYRKRVKGTVKQTKELSVICGVNACAIVYSPYDKAPVKYQGKPEAEVSLKRFTQETFLKDCIAKSDLKGLRSERPIPILIPPISKNFENSERKEKNVEKTKKTDSFRSNSVMSGSVSPAISPESPVEVASLIRDDGKVSNVKKDAEASNSDSVQVGLDPLAQNWVKKVDVQQTLASLHGIALYRLNGMAEFLLKFRSMSFWKGCSGSIVDDLDHGVEVVDRAPTNLHKTTSPLKRPEISSRNDDSIKDDRKRMPSERQEENAAKRIKKITDVKSLSAEKKAVHRLSLRNKGEKSTVP